MPSPPAGKARLEARIGTRCNGWNQKGGNIMVKVLQDGDHRYEVIEDWGTLPDGWSFGEVAAVGVDSRDNVYVFARGAHPMIVFDREGRFLRSWGEGLFSRAHGIHVAPDDTLWCTDD